MLNPRKLGMAGGIVWGGALFITAVISMYTGYAAEWLKAWESVYPWFEPTWPGCFAGLVFGFVDGFIGFYIFGWLYNKL